MMKFILIHCCITIVTGTFLCVAQDSGSDTAAQSSVLFVSDKTDKPATFFIEAFTEELSAAGYGYTDVAVDGKSPVVPEQYAAILVYSQVMAFNNISPVSAWIKKQKSLKGMRMFLFVTANRWFFESRLKKLRKLVTERGGEVVDAVTMATSKMSESQKIESVKKMVGKVRQ